MKKLFDSLMALGQERPKLLVVDDQTINIKIFHTLFGGDCEIFMATDGNQAIKKCLEVLPDLILLDVMMPDIDGYEVCRSIKSNSEAKDIPIIFVTASMSDEDEVKGFELGAVDFIRKPIQPVVTTARVYTQLLMKRQNDVLRALVMQDRLTGLANRRKFDAVMEKEWLLAARMKQPLSLLIIDIDYFKLFNDHYGHPMGDHCLKRVAQTMQASLQRPSDIIARYGGEEFACILPQTDLQGAAHIGRKLLESVKALKIDHKDSLVSDVVTVSIGAACAIPTLLENSYTTFIETADKLLYQAKENGRNQIQF